MSALTLGRTRVTFCYAQSDTCNFRCVLPLLFQDAQLRFIISATTQELPSYFYRARALLRFVYYYCSRAMYMIFTRVLLLNLIYIYIYIADL